MSEPETADPASGTAPDRIVQAHLGPAASCPPTPAVAARMRYCLLADGIANPLDTGAQSSPRNHAGPLPWAYALWHRIVTREEAEPHFADWVEVERLRGLSGDLPLLVPLVPRVFKVTHYTVDQHWLIAALSPSAVTRREAARQAVRLRSLLLADKLLDATAEWVGPSRALGWSGRGLLLDYAVTGEPGPLHGAYTLAATLSVSSGTDGEVPFLWRNPNAAGDPNHVLPCCTWMDATVVSFLARLVAFAPTNPELRALLLHGLACLRHAQRVDGTFLDDYGWNAEGGAAFHETTTGEVMETWIWPALHEARAVLGAGSPAWLDLMLARAAGRYAALNRFRPQDSGFRDQRTMSIAIACAPAWGWR